MYSFLKCHIIITTHYFVLYTKTHLAEFTNQNARW